MKRVWIADEGNKTQWFLWFSLLHEGRGGRTLAGHRHEVGCEAGNELSFLAPLVGDKK